MDGPCLCSPNYLGKRVKRAIKVKSNTRTETLNSIKERKEWGFWNSCLLCCLGWEDERFEFPTLSYINRDAFLQGTVLIQAGQITVI